MTSTRAMTLNEIIASFPHEELTAVNEEHNYKYLVQIRDESKSNYLSITSELGG